MSNWKDRLRAIPIIGGFFTDLETAVAEEQADHGPLSPADVLDGERIARVALRADQVIRRNGRGPLLDAAKSAARDFMARQAEEEEEELEVTQTEQSEDGAEVVEAEVVEDESA